MKTVTPAKKTQAQEKLKADMMKLVSDAKAGKTQGAGATLSTAKAK